ncbi:eukaryotic aspartyl protease family protein [Striga asiatica]|uniref:Eukaryotic aspartyl protease family protein n=1 Tax=Striga asiatica TaxID=4170 RepID=A0A5A7R4V3_STRAF|nr:eukaryotic aspartyl protease family protein [Striga asiatica]
MVAFNWQSFNYFLLAIFFTFLSSAVISSGHGGIKLKLIHTHAVQRPNPATQLERLRQLVHGDTIRLRGISEKLEWKYGSNRRGNLERDAYFPACTNSSAGKADRNASAELEMHSAADEGAGQYLVEFRVGSPAHRALLIADTGSDLTWTNCRFSCRRGGCKRDSLKRRVFRADLSSTFRTVPCSSRTCRDDLSSLFSLNRCILPRDPCAYDYRYADGSSAQGVFGNDSVTLTLSNGRRTRLDNVLVGCSDSSNGPTIQAADGVMGLGYSNHSFALRAATEFGGKFSYCLVDHLSPRNLTSYLVFGPHEQAHNISLNRRLRYTELVLGLITPFYAVNVKGISVGGSMLDIPAGTWDLGGTGGAIIDSGSSLTGLTRPAYGPVMGVLKRALVGFESLDLDIGAVEYCFNSSGFRESIVPRVVIHFMDGARIEPPVKSYVIDAAPGVKCLGFVQVPWPGACVIGNIMQQNHLWEFDLVKGRLGFAPSRCT